MPRSARTMHILCALPRRALDAVAENVAEVRRATSSKPEPKAYSDDGAHENLRAVAFRRCPSGRHLRPARCSLPGTPRHRPAGTLRHASRRAGHRGRTAGVLGKGPHVVLDLQAVWASHPGDAGTAPCARRGGCAEELTHLIG